MQPMITAFFVLCLLFHQTAFVRRDCRGPHNAFFSPIFCFRFQRKKGAVWVLLENPSKQLTVCLLLWPLFLHLSSWGVGLGLERLLFNLYLGSTMKNTESRCNSEINRLTKPSHDPLGKRLRIDFSKNLLRNYCVSCSPWLPLFLSYVYFSTKPLLYGVTVGDPTTLFFRRFFVSGFSEKKGLFEYFLRTLLSN